MDVIRRNTDYALRALVNLASRYGKGAISVRTLSEQEGVSYQLLSKLLQKLNSAGFVTSTMGPTGGYELSKAPAEITLADVVVAIQGPVTINRCVLSDDKCPRKSGCAISANLVKMQHGLQDYLNGVTLQGLLEESEKLQAKGQNDG